MIDEHIARPRRTVIVEEIVSVDAVLRLIVLTDCLFDIEFLLRREAQPLLDNSPTLAHILVAELVERLDAHLVVGAAEDETENEIGLREAEHAIVDDQIHIVEAVSITYSGMPIETPNLITR